MDEPSCSKTEDEPLAEKPSLKRKRSTSDNETVPIKQPAKPTAPKRKQCGEDDDFLSKRSKRFFFLNAKMTKPRKPLKRSSQPPQLQPTAKQNQITCFADSKGSLLLTHRLKSADLCTENRSTYETSKKQDLSFLVLDQVALEGLDGITLEAFWTRLKLVFPNQVNKKMQDRIWRLICSNRHVSIYLLAEPRDKLVLRDDSAGIRNGVLCESHVEEIYPFLPVKSAEVRGSCACFTTRELNNGIRKFSMDKAMKQFGNRLIFVADQPTRNRALICEETDPNVELLDTEYTLLEKVGRSRFFGEITHHNLNKADNRNLHPARKMLIRNHLVANQAYTVRSPKSGKNVTGMILHLSRFYQRHKPPRLLMIEQIATLLRKRPNHIIECTELREILRESALAFLFKSTEFRQFFKLELYNYRELYPNATKSEYWSKSSSCEKQIRVVRMLDPHVNVIAGVPPKLAPDAPLDHHSCKKAMNREYTLDVFRYILSIGKNGVTVTDVHNHFKMDYYLSRMAVQKLIKRKMIDSFRVSVGRQNTQRYFALVHSLPDVVLETNPKVYEIEEEHKRLALCDYESVENVNEVIEIVPEVESAMHFTLPIDNRQCLVYINDFDMRHCENRTIYDLVTKGRDRLLLSFSNLVFVEYENEWTTYVMKTKWPETSSVGKFFRDGLGKSLFEFLIYTELNFQPDNNIIFQLNAITGDTNAGKACKYGETIEMVANYVNPISGYFQSDPTSKIYLLEAMDERHLAADLLNELNDILDRINGRELPTIRELVTNSLDCTSRTLNFDFLNVKYMGSDPVHLHSDVTDPNIQFHYYSSTPPVAVNNSDKFASSDPFLTERYLTRANLILQMVREHEIVRDLFTIVKLVRNWENEAGVDFIACTKSLRTIIAQLVVEGFIKAIKIVVQTKDQVRALSFYCLPHIGIDHMVVKSNIEQCMLKWAPVHINANPKPKMQKVDAFNLTNLNDSIAELKEITDKSDFRSKYKYNPTMANSYGYMPKFVRMRILHLFLYYLIHEQKTIPIEPNDDLLAYDLSADDLNGLPAMYSGEIGEKMFVPPLPDNYRIPFGWIFVSDVILRMPLSIFVKLFRITYEMPDLELYLKHPIRRHFLLKHLPVSIRSLLMYKRRYFFSIYETITRLCYLGLVQMGPRSFKEKDQIFIYLNRKSCLYDTTTSDPGYHKVEVKDYKRLPFEFFTCNEVGFYWSEMQRICVSTPLGKRKVIDGTTITIEDCNAKPELKATLRARDFGEAGAHDLGELPGDGRGAGGFDSAVWSFLKRNWNWRPIKRYRKLNAKQPVKRKAKGQVQRRKKYSRSIKLKKAKKVRKYQDAIDRRLQIANKSARVAWSAEEDDCLKVMRIVQAFLAPKPRNQTVFLQTFRDVLHRLLPIAKNKTTNATRRRLNAINNDELKTIVGNIENLLKIKAIESYFATIRNRYENSLKLTDAQLNVCFIYLVDFVRKERQQVEFHLMGNMGVDYFAPNCRQHFKQLLTLIETPNELYNQPKIGNDIVIDTLKSVIHCSLNCKQNNGGWAFQLYQIYKRFNEELIRTTIDEIKNRQFLVSNRNSAAWHLPLKFSYNYSVMLTGLVFDHALFDETYRKLQSLQNGDQTDFGFLAIGELALEVGLEFEFDIPESAIVLNPNFDDHDEVIDELAKRLLLYLQKIAQLEEGTKKSTETVVEAIELDLEVLKKEVSERVLRVSYLLDGELETHYKSLMQASNCDEFNASLVLTVQTMRKTISDKLSEPKLANFVSSIDECSVEGLSKIVFAIQYVEVSNLGAQADSIEDSYEQFVKPVRISASVAPPGVKQRQSNEITDCINRAKSGVVPSLEEIKSGMMAAKSDEVRQIPHITDLIVFLSEDRFPDLDVGEVDRLKEHFTLLYPKLTEVRCERGPLAEVGKKVQEKKVGGVLERVAVEHNQYGVKVPHMRVIATFLKNAFGVCANEMLTVADKLIDFVKTCGELGASGRTIRKRFGAVNCANLDRILRFLCKKRFLLKAGVTRFVFVHNEFAAKWLVGTFALEMSETEAFVTSAKAEITELRSRIEERLKTSEVVQVLIQPWTKLDGTIDMDVLNQWLCTILSYCLDSPNCMFLDLSQHFYFLKPVDLFYLVEILEELECVKIWCYEDSVCNLFTGTNSIDQGKATYLSDFEDVFIEVTSMSGLYFGHYLNYK